MPATEKEIRRFVGKFKIGKKGECWLWKASKYGDGRYGQFKSQVGVVAHRFAYLWLVGEILEGMRVLHSCDNTLCVNPKHLFLGTDLDNTRDMVSKGRDKFNLSPGPGDAACKGEDHGMAKLSQEDVDTIRRRYRRYGYHSSNAKQLAKEFNVSQMHITRLVKGQRWSKT